MPTAYKITSGTHRRISTVTQAVTTLEGHTIQVQQAGPTQTYRQGAIIEDVTPAELRAFPDRFTPATEAEMQAWRGTQEALAAKRAQELDSMDAAQSAAARHTLTQQIAALEQELSALPGGDPAKHAIEHAPTDPATQERYDREQAALSQEALMAQSSPARPVRIPQGTPVVPAETPGTSPGQSSQGQRTEARKP